MYEFKAKAKTKPLLPRDKITQWILNGCKASEMVILQRPSAKTCPNTFVVMWLKPVVEGVIPPLQYICLDVHYKGDEVEARTRNLGTGRIMGEGIRWGHET